MLPFTTLKTRTDGNVLHVTISHPPLNLIGPAFVSDLVDLIKLIDDGKTPPVIVFDSDVPDFFLSHVDVGKIAEYRHEAARLTGEPSLGLLLRRLSETRAVTIALIDGRTRGAGSEFALACDMRFATREGAIFGQMEASLGVVPGAGAVQHLSRMIGRGRTMEVVLGSVDFNAATAERYGWVNRALPRADIRAFVDALAHRIGGYPKAGLMEVKDRINAMTLSSADEFRVDSDMFSAGVKRPETQARIAFLSERGLQTRGRTELDYASAILEFGGTSA